MNQSDQPGTGSGALLVLAAAVLWGTTGTAQALAPVDAQPVAIGAVRLMVGGVALFGLALAQRALNFRQRWPPLATLCAAGSMAAYQLVFFAAVRQTGVALGTIVAIGSAPILAGVLAWLVRGERPTQRWLMATAWAVAGCTLLVLQGATLAVNGAGVLLALGAGASYAIYALASKQLVTTFKPEAVAAVAFLGAALLLTPLLLFVDLDWLRAPRGLLSALHLGLLATALAYTLYVRGLHQLPTATAVTLSLAEPVVAALLGVVVLGERLTGGAIVGIALLLAGLGLLAVGRNA